ncbi:hypothetical protein [Blastococcus goldschmidtiae]|uniref:DUF222 domain-containing protein n=1 Tax=Blastococcus goldschmidtiae TaxID=3075546 RepID=A0ABU2K3X9_9ACTN|nr:hypothetical protein [Blastococcus sp. DSM 46792]MDT0274905.1 hypothetical protein [Blastococcus sp. DSM 46792]
MTALVPDPVPLDPPPGDPRALADLAARLEAAGALLAELGAQVPGELATASSWTGRDADAAAAQVRCVGELARDAADALLCAGARLARHQRLLEDARDELAVLRRAQEDDLAAAALRIGGVVDPAAGGADPFEELERAEAARRVVAVAIRAEVTDDAAATAAVLAACSAVAGGSGGPGDRARVENHLGELLPGWHEALLGQRGRDFAAELGSAGHGSDLERTAALEAAAREVLPWAGDGALASAVLTELGAGGLRDVLRQLGNGSLSAGSALARTMAAVLGAPVPAGAAGAVARVRDARHVDRDDVRSLESDHVALGMGVVLAAGRGDHRAGPPPATVRAWGRQIVARERALGAERIVDRLGPQPAPAPPGDPLEEVLVRLAAADDPAPAAALLGAEPTWTHLLHRSWDDDGAAFGALVDRAAGEPGDDGADVVRSGLRALATGLGDDGDPTGWTVDRTTAAGVAPALAAAVAARPEVVVEPLSRAATGTGQRDQLLLRGLGYLSAEPEAAVVLDDVVPEAVVSPAGGAGAGPARPGDVGAGYLAVREYGQRLVHALDEFTAQEEAGRRLRITEVVTGALEIGPVWARPIGRAVSVLSVVADADGTWDAAPDDGEHVAVSADMPQAAAYRQVAAVLGTPTAPDPPPIDWMGLAADLAPGGGRARDVIELGGELVEEMRDLVDAVPDRRHPID